MRRTRHLALKSLGACQLWLDGADQKTMYDATTGGSLVASGGSISRWEDKSGNARHATASASQPTRTTLGSSPAVAFNGSQLLAFTSYALPTAFTQIWAFNRSSGAVSISLANNASSYTTHCHYSNNAHYIVLTDGDYQTDAVTRDTTGVQIGASHGATGSVVVRTNGAVAFSINPTRGTCNLTHVGASGALGKHNGTFAEVALYSETLSTYAIRRGEQALARKWRRSI